MFYIPVVGLLIELIVFKLLALNLLFQLLLR